jgi:uncharacterized protein
MGYISPMNRQQILDHLRENEPTLRARGVTHAALFGSRARGDARADSDTDIMIELDPDAAISLFDCAGLKDYIAGLFEGPVDVVCCDNLKPYIRPFAVADAVHAFLRPQRRDIRRRPAKVLCRDVLS